MLMVPVADGRGVPLGHFFRPSFVGLLLAFMVDVYNLQKGERSEMRGCGQEF